MGTGVSRESEKVCSQASGINQNSVLCLPVLFLVADPWEGDSCWLSSGLKLHLDQWTDAVERNPDLWIYPGNVRSLCYLCYGTFLKGAEWIWPKWCLLQLDKKSVLGTMGRSTTLLGDCFSSTFWLWYLTVGSHFCSHWAASLSCHSRQRNKHTQVFILSVCFSDLVQECKLRVYSLK